jgi:adenylate kinase
MFLSSQVHLLSLLLSQVQILENLFILVDSLCKCGIMRIVFLGPPGSGKGTQAQILAQRLEIPQVSTGDLLREAVAQNTAVGRKAKPYMEKGELVPDAIVIDVVRERIATREEFILDGFPRNKQQAEALDQVLSELELPLDTVVNIKVPLRALVERLSGRLTCSKCSAIYHVKYNLPEREGICDVCGGTLYQRSDDTEAAITQRFKTYEKQTEPLIQYYAKKKNLIEIDGTRTIEEIADDIKKRLLKGYGI